MSVRANNLLPDGAQVIARGVQSGLAPNVLPRDQLAWLVNGSSRRNFPHQRPGWKRRLIDGDIVSGRFQGAAIFQKVNELVLSVAGQVYAIDLNSYGARELTTATDRNPNNRRRAWLTEAEDFMLVQDGQSPCLIYNGASTRRAEPTGQEVPTGTAMGYALGRLWVALPDGRSYVGSDLVFSDTGTPAYGRRDAVLRFTENNLYDGGGAFGIPFKSGNIIALVPVAQLDTSLGQGPLQVFTEAGAFSVNAPFDRSIWQEVTFPIQAASLLGAGAVSDWSTVNVNGDVWYRANDGIRSYQVARREFGTWVNAPLSQEASRAFDGDTPGLLPWSSSALFDNRLLTTCSPYFDYDYGIIHRGLGVLDFFPVGGVTSRTQTPVWDGQWSGLKILQVLSGIVGGVERAFIIALGSLNEIQLWEITTSDVFDNDGTDDLLIQWEVEMPSYNWPDAGWGLKQLEFGDVWYDQFQGEISFSVYFRPDQEPNWQTWHSWQSCANSRSCEQAVCEIPPTLAPQYRVRKLFPTPTDACDEITGKPYRRGYEFQPRLVIQGPCRIKKFRLWAGSVPEQAHGGCVDDSVCQTLTACLPDTLAYDIAQAEVRAR